MGELTVYLITYENQAMVSKPTLHQTNEEFCFPSSLDIFEIHELCLEYQEDSENYKTQLQVEKLFLKRHP